MSQKHSVLILTGLGDDTRMLSWFTNHWKHHGLEPMIYRIGWHDSMSFQTKLDQLLKKIDELLAQGNIVSLVGISAGGSAALNTFIERKTKIHKVVNICGRLRTGPTTGFRSFQRQTASSSSFAESVKLFESKEKDLTNVDRQRIMTIRAKFGDELVPTETTTLQGALNIQVPTPEHALSIAMALTISSEPLIRFLK